jgi:hypothetical protein
MCRLVMNGEGAHSYVSLLKVFGHARQLRGERSVGLS